MLRREDLDRRDREFGIIVGRAFEDEESGMIKYEDDEEGRKEIDRRKGRVIVTYLGDMPVYAKVGKEREILRLAEDIGRNMSRIVEAVRKIEKNNEKLGYKEDKERSISLTIGGTVKKEIGVLERR